MNRFRMMTGAALALTLAGFFLAMPARAADADKYLPNDTEVVITVNVRQILESELVKKYALNLLQDAIKGSDEASQILKTLGFNPIDDLTSVTIAAPALDAPDKGLIIIHGKFDLKKFEGQAEKAARDNENALKIHKVRGHKVYEAVIPQQNQNLFVGLVDNDTIVAAPNRDYVVESLDKRADRVKPSLKKELQALVARMDARQSLSVTATGAAIAKGADQSQQKQVKAFAEKVLALTGAITVADDIKLELAFGTKDDDNSKELSRMLKETLTQAKGAVALLAGQQKALEPVLEVLETMKVTPQQGNVVSLKGQVTKEVIENAIKNFAGGK